MQICALDRRVEVLSGTKEQMATIQTVSGLRELNYYVLLGEPGVGKSTVFTGEAQAENAVVQSVRDAMFEEPSGIDTMFLDGLDEYRAEGQASDKVNNLAKIMKASGVRRWRLSCRSEDWRKEADIAAIQKTTGGQPIVVAQLLPLDFREAKEILRAIREQDATGFLERAYSIGAQAFTENPMSLKLLHKAVKSGGAWPRSRFEVFERATKALAFERNSEHKTIRTRPSAEAILDAASRICLRLLATGAEYIWRSGNEPPDRAGNRRIFLNSDDLEIEPNLLNEVLNTPLFRGEGEIFSPTHRTVTEFLSARSLAQLVKGSGGNAIPLKRALALITGDDGAPPTELRGLFGWFAAHLAQIGQGFAVELLVQADPMTVLAYGDAAVLDTNARRSILNTIGKSDPFFRSSNVGITAFGGLAGEDLADDFSQILLGSSEQSHRKYTVLEVLTIGAPVPSLAPALRSIVIDPQQEDWVRERALEALLNVLEDHQSVVRQIFEAIALEDKSVGREAMRTNLAARLWPENLSVTELKDVLSSFEDRPEDNTVGRLQDLQASFEASPDLTFFDTPATTWRSDRTGSHQFYEVDTFLDFGLAASIASIPDLEPERLLQATRNSRKYRWEELGKQTIEAVQAWLSASPERPLRLYKLILQSQDADSGSWVARNEYIRTTKTEPAMTVLPQLFAAAKAASTPAEYASLCNAVIELATRPSAPAELYWLIYEHFEPEQDPSLLTRLSTTAIPDYKLLDFGDMIHRRAAEENEKLRVISILEPQIEELAAGTAGANLDWFATQYFHDGSKDGSSGLEVAIALTNPEIAAASMAGCIRLAMQLPSDLTPKKLGELEAKSSRYKVEFPALVGLDSLIQENRLPPLGEMPIALAIVVLKSSFVAGNSPKHKELENWAVRRLLHDVAEGAKALNAFWSAILKKGYNQLKGLTALKEAPGTKPLLLPVIKEILKTFRAAPGDVLRAALFAGLELFEREELAGFANDALKDPAVVGKSRSIWTLVAFLMEPKTWEADFLKEHSEGGEAPSLDDYFSGELRTRLPAATDEDRAIRDAAYVKILAPRLQPGSEENHRSEGIRVRGALDGLGENPSAEAGQYLRDFGESTDLANWHPYILHATARRQRLERDLNFIHLTPGQVNSALKNGPPANANDLMAIVLDDLDALKVEIRHGQNTSWKRFWNLDGSDPTEPLIENQGRDYLLDRLKDRLERFGIREAMPEARRANETRSDMLFLNGVGQNLPIEVKRHFHPDVWTAASTQLQGYAMAPGAAGRGILLVFWYGQWANPRARPNGGPLPKSADDMTAMLEQELPEHIRGTTSIVVIDVSDPDPARTLNRAAKKATAATKRRRRK